MMEDMEPQGLVPLGYVVLQSLPCTEEEGRVWLQMIARTLPCEMFTTYSWIPLLPGDTN